MTHRSQDAGFTLLELLVSVTLLAFLSAALVAGLRFGTRIWNKSESAEVNTNSIRMAQKLVAQDIARIYPKFVVASPTDSFIDFAGSSHRMEFLSTANQSYGQMTRVTLSAATDDIGVAMGYDSLPELARSNAARSRQILLHHLKSIEFAYFGATENERVPAWHEAWQHERSLPLLIRVRATTARASSSWAELVVRPKIAADVSCSFDPATRFCQGRQ